MQRRLPIVEPPVLLPIHLERPAQAERVLTDVLIEASRRLRSDPVFCLHLQNNPQPYILRALLPAAVLRQLASGASR